MNKLHNTYDEPNHRAQVAGSTAKVKERKSWLQFEGLHYFRVYTWGGQVNVSMFPRQVFVGTVPIAVQVVVAPVYGPEGLLNLLCADVLSFLQVINKVIVVLPGAHSSTHGEKREETQKGGTRTQAE